MKTYGKHSKTQTQARRASSSGGMLLLFQIARVLQNLHDLFIENKFLFPEESPFSHYIFPKCALMDAWVSSLTTWSISAHPSNVSFHLIFLRTPLHLTLYYALAPTRCCYCSYLLCCFPSNFYLLEVLEKENISFVLTSLIIISCFH